MTELSRADINEARTKLADDLRRYSYKGMYENGRYTVTLNYGIGTGERGSIYIPVATITLPLETRAIEGDGFASPKTAAMLGHKLVECLNGGLKSKLGLTGITVDPDQVNAFAIGLSDVNIKSDKPAQSFGWVEIDPECYDVQNPALVNALIRRTLRNETAAHVPSGIKRPTLDTNFGAALSWFAREFPNSLRTAQGIKDAAVVRANALRPEGSLPTTPEASKLVYT